MSPIRRAALAALLASCVVPCVATADSGGAAAPTTVPVTNTGGAGLGAQIGQSSARLAPAKAPVAGLASWNRSEQRAVSQARLLPAGALAARAAGRPLTGRQLAGAL